MMANMEAAQDILFNIIGGVLTVPATYGIARLWKVVANRRFRKVFGDGEDFLTAYGSLTVNPSLGTGLARQFPLTKQSDLSKGFSAENVASASEIRAAAYLAMAFASQHKTSPRLVSDESIRSRLDCDFVSFGVLSNFKTLDALSNSANRFVDYDVQTGMFVSKSEREPLHRRRAGFDYGIVLRLHPAEFPSRTWLACAGIGEWGTSGAAWFLSNKWAQIEKRLNDDAAFLCIVEVRTEQDESANLIHFASD